MTLLQREEGSKSEVGSLALLRKKIFYCHHPYESFDPVVKLVSDAASWRFCRLYTVSAIIPIVAALARAAENGKAGHVVLC